MRHLTLLCALLASTPALAAPPASATQQDPVLERVVLVARHGVRSPTKPPQTLQTQTGHVWAQWPVAPGELTDHGKQALEQMVGMVRQHYVKAGLLPATGCPTPGSVTIWLIPRITARVKVEPSGPNIWLPPASSSPSRLRRHRKTPFLQVRPHR
ncbi:histidine-type phosphatase [Acetobacter papayae]|uniref:histidine-type phosphatase n=1 Tax=Acetobacter papayae TaxID=1076592 RepID=UPI0011DC9626|nr:histidine-type phosphatase [Acetobacter papayae]